jgi:hypothetical protein
MSINPVSGIEAASTQWADGNPYRNGSAAANPRPAPPDPGTSPKQEAHLSQSTPSLAELPQDEVQVQRDSGTNDEIVIRYVDRYGQLILQVPSSQVLEVARAIDQEMAQEAKLQANASAQSRHEGGKLDGD